MKRKNLIDETKAFEDALAAHSPAEHYLLRLFVTGSTPKSARAIRNIRALGDEKLQGSEQVRGEQIVVTPTLVKKLPLHFRKIIGDLSDKERVLAGLDLVPRDLPHAPPENPHGA